MQKETEIKLRVSRETLAALREHPLLKKRNKSGWERRELMNQYFDTPERDLAQAKVALRLRKDGDEIIQTLKTRGQSVAGLSERNEYNWDLAKAKLDVKKLDGECWPEQLAELDKKTLKPIFTTDFVRERAEIAWGRGKAKVVIEAALDLGHVVVGKQKEEICELELELREGEPAALLELAAELAATLALMPCDISKAERGYRLYDASSYSLSLPAPQIHAEMPLDDAFAAIMWHLLGSSQRLAEQYRFNGHWRLLQDWVENLGELRALIGSLGQAAPRQSTSELRSALDALLEDWRPLVQAGDDDEDIRKAAPEQFVEELDDVRWGLFSLNTSRWLLARTWTADRNVRGNRQGAAQITNWLPRLLADDAVALQLPRYQQQPEDLAEQLPRIERIQAWLHHARHVVDIPEMDRLYGELNKLAQLANQPITDESLDARMHQTIAVYQNRAMRPAQSTQNWQAGRGLDLRQRHNRIDLLNPRHHRQLLKEKPLVRLDIRRNDAQQKIHRPHQHITLQDFRKPANRVGELGEVGAPVSVEFYLGEYLRVEANLLAIQQGHLRANHALLLEPLDAPPAR